MPEINGYQATKEIRKIKNKDKAYIIALTACTIEGEKEKCLNSGMDVYISKPIYKESY